ncbi:MAG: LmbE family protein, partial [bacterium]|nr:LmbE family protein [bacterium]
ATLEGFASHITADIGHTLERKIESIRCYKSQFPPAKEYIFDRVRGAALTAGSAAGFDAGEVFVSTRSLGTRDLMQSILK